jgi:hypothetical protein
MRWAYADPPYPGQAKRHYSHDPNAREVNHRMLFGYLDSHFDAWAVSTSSTALHEVLASCPDDIRAQVRVMAWVKPFASFKPGVRVAYAWEPVLVKGCRKGGREDPTVRDWVAANITMRRGLSGVKPDAFCVWLFEVIGAMPTDDFEDVFPGSGAVSLAWSKWCGRPPAGDLFAYAAI